MITSTANQTIDERVVEMRFDNKQFEAGAKETMGTLGKLKEALKLPDTAKALEGIDQATRHISLDGIAAGVDALNRRFSTLGIVGMRVIQNITDGLMNKLNAAVNFVSNSIVSGGIRRAMNIENAHFQLQALLKDEVKVQAVMADAMESVDGTAYAYDEAAKAASQFAASGIQAGEEMLNALKGITGVAAMTNSQFADVSRIFTTIAGNGRIMGDQLLQLSARGLNAASTLADYFRQVRGEANMTEAQIREMVSKGQISFRDFSDAMTWAFGDSAKRANETFTGSMSNMKSALARIGAGFISPLVEQNGGLVQLFNALRIKINDVKATLVFDEQRSAISGLAEVTGLTKDELSSMFSTIKTDGKVSMNTLNDLAERGANAEEALTKYINGVVSGTTRSTYAIKTALMELTQGTEVSTEDIRRFVEEGKIDLATFTSAMETEFGNEMTLSKQFTDFFLDNLGKVVDKINQADVTKPMEAFYYWVEIVKNGVKGLYSIVKPIGSAFSETLLVFDVDDIIEISAAIETFTSKLKLSEDGSKDLRDAAKGLFDVVKLGVDIFIKLLKAIVPINKPVAETGKGFLGLAGYVGRMLTKFTEAVRSCETLKRAFNVVSSGFSTTSDAIVDLIRKFKSLVHTVYGLEGAQKLINAISKTIEKAKNKILPYIVDFIDWLEKLINSAGSIKGLGIDITLDDISNAFSKLADSIEGFGFKKVELSFDGLSQKIKDLRDLLMSNEGLSSFVTNAKQYGEALREAFTLDNLLDRIERIMDIFGKFFQWIKENVKPAFEGLSAGDVTATAGGLGIVYAMIKASKALEKLSTSIKAIPNVFGAMRGTLVAYQKELNAKSLVKIATAIAILSGALVLLSFADMDRLMSAAVAFSMVSGTLMLGFSKLLEAMNKGKETNDALRVFANGLSSTMKKFGRAIEIKAIGNTIKQFAQSIAIIAISIAALAYIWRKDPEAFETALATVGGIALVLAGIAEFGVLAGKFGGKGIRQVSGLFASITSLAAGLAIVVFSLGKLFSMTLPSDWEVKLEILSGLLVGLAVLSLILGLAGRIAGGGSASALAGMKSRFGSLLSGISTSSNGGSITAGPILALAGMLYVTVSALNKLFKMTLPSDWEEKIFILGGIFAGFSVLMVALGAASRLAGGSIKAAGTILSMSVFLVTIIGSLMILSLLPVDKLFSGAIGLGMVLTTLGAALFGAGKITSKDANKSVLAMAIIAGAIAASLAVLTMIPFPKLLSSTGILGTVLIILAADFRQISKITNEKAWLNVAAMVTATLSIAYSLYTLAEQPWQNMLASAGALSATLLAMGEAFKIVSSKKANAMDLAAFLVASISVGLIASAIKDLSTQPWENLLAAGTSVSLVILAMSEAMAICSSVAPVAQNAIFGMGLLDVFIVNLVAVLAALGAVFRSDDAKELLSGGSQVLTQIGQAIGGFVGGIVNGVLSGIAGSLPAFGSGLAGFMENIGGFAEGAKLFDENVLKGVGVIAASIIAITAAEVIAGIGSFLGGAAGMLSMATNLVLFIKTLNPFLTAIKGIDPDSTQAVKNLAEMIIILTAADLISGIGRFFGLTGNLSDFGKELIVFGPSIALFAKTVKDINPEAVKGAASAAEIMANMSEKLPGTGGLKQKIFGDKSLSEFGEELVKFGPSIVEFAEIVKDVKPEAVTGAAQAAEIMANLSDKLPTTDGFFQKIFGTKSLSAFGKELVSFGPSIVEFGETVKDVKPEAVKGAAQAAEIMTNLSDKLPTTDGLFQKIFGSKSLSSFGKELVKFGPAISEFGETVKDVKPEAVKGATAASEIMLKLSENLPVTGGLKQKIFGDKSLSEFGEELVSFGPSIVEFAETVNGLKAGSLSGVTVITTMMTELSEKLPDTETLWNKIFGGGKNTLTGFGNELVKFGKSMKSLSESLSGVDVDKLSVSITSFKDLMELSKNVESVSAQNFIDFSKELSKIGTEVFDTIGQTFSDIGPQISGIISEMTKNIKNGLSVSTFNPIAQNALQGFVNGINAKRPLALSTSKNFCTAVINQFKVSLPVKVFNTIAQNALQGFVNGMASKRPSVVSTVRNLCAGIIEEFRINLSPNTFKTLGANIVVWIIQGMDSKKNSSRSTIEEVSTNIIRGFKENLTETKFREIGENAALGLKNGIESRISDISDSAVRVANAAVTSAKRELDEHSPSRVFFEIGKFISLGLANGITGYIRTVSKAATKAADGAVDPVKNAMSGISAIIDSGNFDVDPVIRPIVDLSDVQRGVKEISSLMNQTFDLSAVYENAMQASSTFRRQSSSNVGERNDQNPSSNGGVMYEFIQNNYSPKELSRSEIYRQTSNQFASFRKAVNPS